MDDEKKTKKQLIQELEELRRRMVTLKQMETRSQQAMDALPGRELTIQTISKNLQSGMIYQVIRKDDGTRVFTCLSDTVRRYYGIEPEEGLADSSLIYGKVHEGDRIRVSQEEEEANRTLSPFRSEVRMMDPMGGIRWSLFVSHPRRLADGATCWDGIEFDITDRKRAEIALRESEEKLRLSQDIGKIGNWSWDIASGRAEWSDQVYNIFGAPRGEASYEFAKSFVHPDDLDLWQNTIRQAVEKKEPFSLDFRVLHSDGEIIWVHDETRTVFNESAELIGYHGTVQDITDRKRAEEALRSSEDKFSRVFKTSPNPSTIIRLSDGIFLDVNESFTRVTGYSIEEIVGRPYFSNNPDIWIDQKDRVRLVAALKRTGEVQGIETQFRGKDGQLIYGLISARALEFNGELCIVGIVNDITEQKRVEEALRKTQNQLKIVFDTVPALIWLKDTNEKYVAVNKAYLHTFNLAEEDVIKKMDYDLFPRELADQFVSDDREVLSSGKPKINIEEHFPVGSGEWRWNLTNRMVYYDEDDNATGTIGFALDITDRKRAENALSKSEKRLRALSGRIQSVREEERVNIAREIHDDLGQQLTGLKLDLGWLLLRLKPDQSELKEKAKTMGQLIDQTVQTIRRISTELRPRILDDFGLIAALEWQAQEFTKKTGIPCRFRSSILKLNLKADPSIAVFRIFQEALTNVARHSQATHVEVSLNKTVQGLTLSIQDNGQGISDREIARSKSLGLLGMRERSLIFGGTFDIKGQKGKGTTVILRLPIAK
jgi:PAS domain S-box-containing protein